MNPVCFRTRQPCRRTRPPPTALVLIPLLVCLLLFTGCTSDDAPSPDASPPPVQPASGSPGTEDENDTGSEGSLEPNATESEQRDFDDPHQVAEDLIAMAQEPVPVLPTPTPVPTSSVTVADTPDSAFTAWKPRPSVFFSSEEISIRTPFHRVYFEPSIRITSQSAGRILDIINGPFEIRFVTRPTTNDPALPWARLTIRDINGTVVAEGGYRKQYSNLEEDAIRVYGVGQYHLTMEGGFVTMDLSLYTTDPVPEQEATPAPLEYYDEYEEEEMWY